jgi:hypothetical protein
MPRKRKLTPGEKVDLANTYIGDGALHTGVRLLREAADEIEAMAKKQDAALEKLMGKKPAKTTGK